MQNPSSLPVTILLERAKQGDRDAGDKVLRAIGSELKRLAKNHMRRERPGHLLQPTALLNEAWLKLFAPSESTWNNRSHFLAVASVTMRRILTDYARAQNAGRRGGDCIRVELPDITIQPLHPRLLDLDVALQEFETFAPRQAKLVELRFFGGLSLDECAEVLQVSARTIDKDWTLARAWFQGRLTPLPNGSGGKRSAAAEHGE